MESEISRIAEKITSSKKYANIAPEAVYREVENAAGRYRKQKEIEKAAKERLHAVSGAFAERETLDNLNEALRAGDLQRAFMLHASTRERMPLGGFYERIFDVTGRPGRVLDAGCGISPLFLASMGIEVTGIDMNKGLMSVINDYASESNLPARCFGGDLLTDALPDGHYDIAFFMKLLPVIEQQKKGASASLLGSANAVYRVVSFPTRSLGGRNVGMGEHYSAWFENLEIDGEIISRFIVNNELVYVIK